LTTAKIIRVISNKVLKQKLKQENFKYGRLINGESCIWRLRINTPSAPIDRRRVKRYNLEGYHGIRGVL